MESEGLNRSAHHSEPPVRQFAALRKSNEYHAHVAQLLQDKRKHRTKVERVIQAQRKHRFRQVD